MTPMNRFVRNQYESVMDCLEFIFLVLIFIPFYIHGLIKFFVQFIYFLSVKHKIEANITSFFHTLDLKNIVIRNHPEQHQKDLSSRIIEELNLIPCSFWINSLLQKYDDVSETNSFKSDLIEFNVKESQFRQLLKDLNLHFFEYSKLNKFHYTVTFKNNNARLKLSLRDWLWVDIR